MVQIEQDILGKNNAYAADNRQYFASTACSPSISCPVPVPARPPFW